MPASWAMAATEAPGPRVHSMSDSLNASECRRRVFWSLVSRWPAGECGLETTLNVMVGTRLCLSGRWGSVPRRPFWPADRLIPGLKGSLRWAAPALAPDCQTNPLVDIPVKSGLLWWTNWFLQRRAGRDYRRKTGRARRSCGVVPVIAGGTARFAPQLVGLREVLRLRVSHRPREAIERLGALAGTGNGEEHRVEGVVMASGNEAPADPNGMSEDRLQAGANACQVRVL